MLLTYMASIAVLYLLMSSKSKDSKVEYEWEKQREEELARWTEGAD